MTKKRKKKELVFPLPLPRSFFISISQLANNRARSQTRFSFSWWTRGKILMERFRLSAGDRETFFSVESARRPIYTLPARHPLILFGLRLSPSLSHFTACFDELGIHRSLPIRSMGIKCRNFLGFGVRERQSWVQIGDRASSNMFLIWFSLGYVPFVRIVYSNRKYFILVWWVYILLMTRM